MQTGSSALICGLIDSIPRYQGECVFNIWKLKYSEIQKNTHTNSYYYVFDNRNFCQKVPAISSTTPEKLKNTLFGPIGVPSNWERFPQAGFCLEKKWNKTLSMMGHYIVHSARVRDHLMQRSNTYKMVNKYGIMRACSNMKFSPLKKFNERRYDILYYEKYMDLNRSSNGLMLYDMLMKAKYNVKRVSYLGKVEGAPGYNLSSFKKFANDSKFVIYFSFWDTGAIALKEIQNFGVYSFSVQDDLIHNQTGLFVPELDGNIKKAFDVIDKKIKQIGNNLDVDEIARINQYENSCERSLEDLCEIISK